MKRAMPQAVPVWDATAWGAHRSARGTAAWQRPTGLGEPPARRAHDARGAHLDAVGAISDGERRLDDWPIAPSDWADGNRRDAEQPGFLADCLGVDRVGWG